MFRIFPSFSWIQRGKGVPSRGLQGGIQANKPLPVTVAIDLAPNAINEERSGVRVCACSTLPSVSRLSRRGWEWSLYGVHWACGCVFFGLANWNKMIFTAQLKTGEGNGKIGSVGLGLMHNVDFTQRNALTKIALSGMLYCKLQTTKHLESVRATNGKALQYDDEKCNVTMKNSHTKFCVTSLLRSLCFPHRKLQKCPKPRNSEREKNGSTRT